MVALTGLDNVRPADAAHVPCVFSFFRQFLCVESQMERGGGQLCHIVYMYISNNTHLSNTPGDNLATVLPWLHNYALDIIIVLSTPFPDTI